ncbi:MAG: hypothetical protein OEN56_14590 [Gemmatimonadota bacterium]|nr:hypothetical protein [Gemmatimonadota bacterium]
MDFIKDILEERGGDLFKALAAQDGFPTERAEAFLPEAGRSVATAMTSRASDLDLANLASSVNVGTILQGIDIPGLASRAGVTPEQGSRGLAAIVPMILGFVGEKGDADGILGMLGKVQGLGGALGGVKGLGKLFGR